MICMQYKLVKPFVIETFFNDVKPEGTSHLIVRPEKLSICKADMRYYFGQRDAAVLKKRLPMTLIHEACGRVMYDPTGQYKSGDKVVLLPNIPGSDIFYDENYRLDSVFRSSRADGFMQEALRIRHEQAVPYRSDLPDEVMSFTEFISVGVHAVNSFKQIAHSRREQVGVWGDGSLSYVVCCLLKSLCPETKITVVGLNPGKLQYFNFADEILTVNQVEQKAKFDHCFECVGGTASGAAVEQMINSLHPQGTIMLLGVSEEPVPINTRMVLEKGLTLLGRSRSGRDDFQQAVDILQSDEAFLARMKHLISVSIDIEGINDISRAFEIAKTADFKVVLGWNI